LARRDLRGAAESLSLVALGLLTLDVFGADNAGWFGDLTVPAFLVVLGAVLTAAATSAAVLVRRTPAGALTGTEVVAVIGVGLITTGVASSELLPDAPGFVLAVVAAALAAVGALQLDLRILTVGAGVVGGFSWLALLADGLERALRHDTLSELWLDLHAWPLVVAAALVAVLATVPALPRAARLLSAMVACTVLTLAVLTPVIAASATDAAYAVIALLVLYGVFSWYGPRRWRLVPAMSTGMLVAWLVILLTPATAQVAVRLLDMADAAWTGQASERLPGLAQSSYLMAPWLLPVSVVVLCGTALALAQADPRLDRLVGPVVDLRAGVALVALALVGTLASYSVPVWSIPAALLLVTLGLVAWWWRGQSLVPLVLAGLFLAAAVVVSWYAEVLTEATLAVALAVAVLVLLRARSSDVAAVAGAAGAASMAGLGWTTGALLGAAEPWTAFVTLLVLAAVALPLPWLPDRWWRCTGPAQARAGAEVGVAAVAVPLGLAGALLATPGTAATWAAVYLTVAGAAVCTTAVLRPERQLLGWPGGLLLATASWVRLWDIGVREPEPYTLPGALALGVVGVLALRRQPGSATLPALSPALSLALVPSLLWALAEPPGLRSLLLGLGCLALILVGVRLQWTAPVLYGAVAGGLLVLRLAAPYIGDAVPRWLLIGAAGALLIAVGVTWEARLRDARQVMGYVRALR
jgi:hypothetical protein